MDYALAVRRVIIHCVLLAKAEKTRHPSRQVKSSLHFVMLEIGNWKLEIRADESSCYPVSNFEFPVSTSAFNSIIHAFSKKV